jgi:hypothetical protein
MLILLLGCQGHEVAETLGLTDPYSVEAYISPQLVPFVGLFKQEAEARDVNVSEGLRDIRMTLGLHLRADQAATCTRIGDAREVVVNQFHWDVFTMAQKEWVISHELGHCILERDHLHTSDGLSFMNHNVPKGIDALDALTIRFLYDELFGEL